MNTVSSHTNVRGETHGADRTRDLDHVRDASFAALGSKDSAEKFARRVIHHRPSKSVPLIFPRERRMRYPIGTREPRIDGSQWCGKATNEKFSKRIKKSESKNTFESKNWGQPSAAPIDGGSLSDVR